MTPEILQTDAIEMASVLKGTLCIQRHFVISYDKLAEILTALCTDGQIGTARNGTGYDVEAPNYGRIEVKSRFLGTDGPFPRISLSPTKLKSAKWFMAVRWHKQSELYAALMLPLASVQPLFDARLQANGKTAHIPWEDWLAARDLQDFTSAFQLKLRGSS
jgi:hypothetical protein